ncbi:MAG TPA: hypothetical protein VHB48_06730 [Chitinophagaceae bacterium]|nr:hypothetical protein [Chitinophagaceae bacterium]
MNFHIIPYRSTGNIQLGFSKLEINKMLGSVFTSITYDYSLDVADNYKDLGLQLDYDEFKNCTTIHIEAPSNAIYENHNLHLMLYSEILSLFSVKEKNAYIDDNNILFIDVGIAFSFGDDKEKKCPAIVTIFKEGLFDEFLHNYERLW